MWISSFLYIFINSFDQTGTVKRLYSYLDGTQNIENKSVESNDLVCYDLVWLPDPLLIFLMG